MNLQMMTIKHKIKGLVMVVSITVFYTQGHILADVLGFFGGIKTSLIMMSLKGQKWGS